MSSYRRRNSFKSCGRWSFCGNFLVSYERHYARWSLLTAFDLWLPLVQPVAYFRPKYDPLVWEDVRFIPIKKSHADSWFRTTTVTQSRRSEFRFDIFGYHTSGSVLISYIFTLPTWSVRALSTVPTLPSLMYLDCFVFFPVKEPRWGCSSVACQMCNWVQKMLYHLERPHDLRLSTLSSGHDQDHSVE